MGDNTSDHFALICAAGTDASNYGMVTEDIIAKLQQWQSLCSFTVTAATHDSADIEFTTLPADMDAFVRDLYDFCPDLVDQGAGCVHEMVDMLEETGEELPPEMAALIEGIDFSDKNYGLEILKRELQNRKAVKLWWD